MLTTVEDIVSDMGIDPARLDPAGYACPCCVRPQPLPLFALVVEDDGTARCADCRIDEERAAAPAFELTWADIRGERAVVLAASDWTQLPDVPEATRGAWRAYRQAWRDITLQDCAPCDVVRPVPPS